MIRDAAATGAAAGQQATSTARVSPSTVLRRLRPDFHISGGLPTLAAGATLAMLLAMTISTTIAVRTFIRDQSVERFESAVANATASVNADVVRGLTELRAVEGLFKASDSVDPPHFNAFAASVKGRGSVVQSLGYVRRVLPRDVGQFNSSMQARGLVGYNLSVAGPEYLVVEHMFPSGLGNVRLGADLRDDPLVGDALDRARQTRQPAAAGPLLMAGSRASDVALLVFAPVYMPALRDPVGEVMDSQLKGFAIGAYRFEDFLKGLVDPDELRGTRLRVVDLNPGGAAIEIFPEPGGDSRAGWPGGHRTHGVIEVAGRTLEIQFLGPADFGLSPLESAVWVIVMSAGMAITLVAAGSTYSLLASRRAVRTDLDVMTTQLSVILESALEGILLTDADQKVAWANQAFAGAFGLGSFETLAGRDLIELLSGPGAAVAERSLFVARVQEVFDAEEITVTSEDVVVTAPERHTLSMTSVPVAGETGNYTGRLWVFRDVTSERAATEAKSVFVSMVSHELRTPLTSVLGFIDLALDGAGGALSESTAGLLHTARSNAERLQRLVNDVLETSRLESGGLNLDMGLVEIGDLAGGLVNDMRSQFEQHELTVKVVIPDSLPPIWADKGRMAQVLTNLLTNALKYTPSGGSVTISAQQVRRSVETSVSDTGAGIPPEHRERVFEKFARLDHDRSRPGGGTGLGLAITKSLVVRMGGSIRLESEVGVGSTFTVTLPVAPASNA